MRNINNKIFEINMVTYDGSYNFCFSSKRSSNHLYLYTSQYEDI